MERGGLSPDCFENDLRKLGMGPSLESLVADRWGWDEFFHVGWVV